ncbi:hypothetical protein ONS95_006080 [Cadophora gregata]|uniref:uncharacterized protein n=1 Tax=Cadophora gregata TaxID=51156 RepID=UPI0026DD4F31|nr:uncharacterized protein ONS95_006080 [Cadophora gregata]KAK0102461.1 hypothetical protein ONS95_006080 [Cadophora gregata]KAK0104089.1 hypothetical protein ONS96_005189 [Cadophora gregata f. sp. sojae]
MSTHEKKVPRASNLRTNKSPIATPPRAALHGRSKTDHSTQQQVTSDNASTKSGREGSGAVSGGGADTTSTSPASEVEDSASISSISISLPNHSREILHEKDRKIADLERELSVMESEFSAELTTLSHKLTNESETVQFWQQKHSSLNQTFLQTDTDLRLLKQEIAGFAEAREERDRDIKTRISSLILDRDAFREAYNEAMGEVRGKEEMVRLLQGQVRGLKSWVSSSSKVGEQVSDEVFGEEMRRLGNGLQNWVITHFRRVRIDTSKAPDSTLSSLEHLVPAYESLASSSKIHLIQSLVSQLLVTHVFSAYFIGLAPEQANELANVEKTLSNFGSAESMNQWRSTTLSILRKESQKLQPSTTAVIDDIVSQVNNIMDGISDTKHTEGRDQALRSMIGSSIELSRQLRVQKAAYSIMMPRIVDYQKTMFDADSMEDIGGEDEDSLSDREIKCVTFPGIVKAGDENGEKSHLRNVVAKIRVLCAPD